MLLRNLIIATFCPKGLTTAGIFDGFSLSQMMRDEMAWHGDAMAESSRYRDG